jgi:hypothetical protein
MTTSAIQHTDSMAFSLGVAGGISLGTAVGQTLYAAGSHRDAKVLTRYANEAQRAPVPKGHWQAEALAWRNNAVIRRPLEAAIGAGSVRAGIEELQFGARQAATIRASHLRTAGVISLIGAGLLIGANVLPQG